jgi:hypothetical protein
LSKLWQHREDDIGDIEGDMCDEHAHIPSREADEREQHHKADARHEVGVHHGKLRDIFHDRAGRFLHGVKADGGKCAEHCGDYGG